jgi:hypothetical protein
MTFRFRRAGGERNKKPPGGGFSFAGIKREAI